MHYTSLLLIDDDTDDQLLFNEALHEINMPISCDTAPDGMNALKKLQAGSTLPDIIFLDLNMPIMHGFECLKKIKAHALLQTIPVIIFTTSNSPIDINMAKQYGAAAYFCKPMHFNQLCSQLKSILNKSLRVGNMEGFKIIE
jgi:CheY-like chemotaxis protein